MGANAQTSVPTFTAGEVLTAANMNISARTGVPVFADTTARDAAFGGTGEKTLAEGQLAYVENLTGIAQLQYYDGAAWVSFAPAGLQYITGAAFTTVTSFSLPNSTFTSAYRNYKLIVQITAVTSDADFTMRLRASGSDDTNNAYGYNMPGYSYAAAASNSIAEAQTSLVLGEQDNSIIRYFADFDIIAPQLATPTYFMGSYNFLNKAAGASIARSGVMQFTNATQFDSLSFISSVASSITGVYRVYGYSES